MKLLAKALFEPSWAVRPPEGSPRLHWECWDAFHKMLEKANLGALYLVGDVIYPAEECFTPDPYGNAIQQAITAEMGVDT